MKYKEYVHYTCKAYNSNNDRYFIDDLVSKFPHNNLSHDKYVEKLMIYQSNTNRHDSLSKVVDVVYKNNSSWLSRLRGSYNYYKTNKTLIKC